MLTEYHQGKYDSFYESTHNNEFLDTKTEVLVGLSAAIALNCAPCTAYYLKQAKQAKISKGEVSEVVAKVMAVASGQKRLQVQEVIQSHGINLDAYT